MRNPAVIVKTVVFGFIVGVAAFCYQQGIVSKLMISRSAAQAIDPTFVKETPWSKLNTVAFPGKQDDIFFTNPNSGWYGNGKGLIYKTEDGGLTWKEVLKQPGTYFRAMGFVDENHGYAGNIGPDYF